MAPDEAALTSAADKRILIVDDEPGVIEYLELILTKEGFQIETAADGQEALQKILKSRPDLIVLDLKLPKIQGLELLRILQANNAGHVPVFIITGRMSNRETEQMIKQEPNVKGYYPKPVHAGLLTMNIHSLLRTRPAFRGQARNW
jgi:DNA-binding response OmpR family regulator